MYLGNSIRDFQGQAHQMVGVFPVSSRIDKHRLSLGYRTVEALDEGPLLSPGEKVRGHEFHWSVLEDSCLVPNAYRIVDKDDRVEGYQKERVLASYIHLHFASLPSVALRFIETCNEFGVKARMKNNTTTTNKYQ